MKKKHSLLILTLFIIGIAALLSFKETPMSSEERIQGRLQQKIDAFHKSKQQQCQKRALRSATPIVDSLVAEMYAKDLRAKDFLLKRPEKPEMPNVEINPFPLDSVE